ncbi:MAG: sugar phosphate nucleotidyltransferase [Bacilli bacterium]
MKKDKTLLIMAAGMGSRFGGLKQIEPIGPSGEFLIDYSIYDAVKAGFNKVVFIIKEENYRVFKDTIGVRVEDKIKVEYVYQKLDSLPKGYSLPAERVKPWGTSHAVLAAKDHINEPFVIINADDFYGRDAYLEAAKFIDNQDRLGKEEYAMISYLVKNTLTANGSVKRGVCFLDNNYLTKIVESSITRINGSIIAAPLDSSEPFAVEEDSLVSMNMFVFMPSIFTYIEEHFTDFLLANKDNLTTCEYLIPDTVTSMINAGVISLRVIPTTAVWQGVTYKEDKDLVVKEINSLVQNNVYPLNLWTK